MSTKSDIDVGIKQRHSRARATASGGGDSIVAFTELAEVRMFYTDGGGVGDPPVLLVHGWTCDSHDWSWQLPGFAVRHRVVAPDIRGHGRSSIPEGGWDPHTFAGDLAELLDELACGPVVGVGHSLGAMIVSALAIERPDLVRAVVAVDPAYGVAGPLAEMMSGLFDVLRSDVGPEVAAGALAGVEGTGTSEALRVLHRRRALGMDPTVLAEVFCGMYEPSNQFGFRAASEAYLARRHCPVLALHQTSETRSWEAGIAQHEYSRTVLWEGIGHWLHQVRPEEFNALVLDWIAGLPSG
jgi:pimeloyl-ACP methyl ester carboxylesterase